MKTCLRLALLWFVPRAFSSASSAAPAAKPRIDVILWFDTEDYLLPADDDASKRLAEMLTERNIRATFKVVGEKARVLEKRGRSDVIAALKKHDIGYHANFHSVHPTPSEYLADCGLLDGVAEFVRREGGGAADVRRIFAVNTLSCYGQPGSSWGAQTLAGLSRLIERFDDPSTPYASLRRPAFAGTARYDDYAHLARVKEWSLATEDEADE